MPVVKHDHYRSRKADADGGEAHFFRSDEEVFRYRLCVKLPYDSADDAHDEEYRDDFLKIIALRKDAPHKICKSGYYYAEDGLIARR